MNAKFEFWIKLHLDLKQQNWYANYLSSMMQEKEKSFPIYTNNYNTWIYTNKIYNCNISILCNHLLIKCKAGFEKAIISYRLYRISG